MIMADKKIQDLNREELIVLCEKQEKEIRLQSDATNYWADKSRKLEKKLETLKNIIEL